jgi:16S rRNA (guanine527-N7)-methyltransferase
MISTEKIAAVLAEYDLIAPPSLCEKVRLYVECLLRWNQRIALTAITHPEEIVREHFAESFVAAKFFNLQTGRLADVGSGAGFPGLALKLYVPALAVTLIEPSLKKAAFLHEAARTIGVEPVEVLQKRFQDVCRPEGFDVITSRALGRFDEFLVWSRSAIAEKGLVMLWVGESALAEVPKDAISWAWRAPYRLPQTRNRYILAGSPS